MVWRARGLGLALLGASLIVPGTATADWPVYGRDLANSRNAGGAGPSTSQVGSIKPAWTFSSATGDFTGTPVVAGGVLVVGNNGGWVYALDAITGKQRWSHKFDAPVNASAAIVPHTAARNGGLVYVPVATPGRPHLVALGLDDGAIVWDTALTTQDRADTYGSPVVWSGKVYIGTSGYFGEFTEPGGHVRGSVVALDARTGAIQWQTFTVPPGSDGGAVWSTPAIDTETGRLYVGTGNAYHEPAADTTDAILALDASTGAILKRFQATANDVWTAADPSGPDFDFGASPNLFHAPGGHKLVGEGQKSGIYWAFDRATLAPVWQTRVGAGSSSAGIGGIMGSTAVDGARIYGPNATGNEVFALGLGGDLRWLSLEVGPLNFSPVTVANGVVYISDFSGVVTARDAASGLILTKLPLGAPTFGGVSVVGGAVYAAVGTGPPPTMPDRVGPGSVVAFGDTSHSGATPGEPGAAPAHPETHLTPGKVIAFPRARSCSRHSLTIRLRKRRGVRLRKATIYVNGRRTRVVTGRRLSRRIILHRLPSGTLRIRIAVRTSTGRVLISRRTYRRCRQGAGG